MKLPRVDFSFISRILIFLAILLYIGNFNFHNKSISYLAIVLAVLSVIFMILFMIQIRQGIIRPQTQIILETNVEKALADGVITEEQAKQIPKKVVLNSHNIFLNMVFNLSIPSPSANRLSVSNRYERQNLWYKASPNRKPKIAQS